MPKLVYLGEKLDFSRSHNSGGGGDDGGTGEPGKVIPGLSIVDADAEPLQVNVAIPSYDGTFAPLREVHLFAYPTGTQLGTAQELLDSPPEFRANTDVTNVQDATISLDIPGLPDGSWFLQPVFVAGSD